MLIDVANLFEIRYKTIYYLRIRSWSNLHVLFLENMSKRLASDESLSNEYHENKKSV